MGKNRILISLDLGTDKTTVLVGDFDDTGELNIIGFGESKTEGIEKGLIVKPNNVIDSIRKAISDAETTSGVSISSAIVNISNAHIEFENISEFLTYGTNQKEIDDTDISTLTQKISEKLQKEQNQIIHIIPKRFILDDIDEVIDPRGFLASKIQGEFHVILSKINTFANLKKVIENSGISVIDFVYNPIASSSSVLYPEEKEMGTLLIDIGGGTTDIAVLKDGSFEFTKTIPLGGNRITLDIAHRFRIPKTEAEELKINYGMAISEAVSEDQIIEITPIGSEEKIQISQYELVDTIEARLDEILNLVKKEVELHGFFNKLNGGVVLTGGVANIPYIKELAYDIFNMDVRIGKPKDYVGFSDKLNNPKYATSIGMMLFKKDYSLSKKTPTISKPKSDILSIFKDLLERIKQIF